MKKIIKIVVLVLGYFITAICVTLLFPNLYDILYIIIGIILGQAVYILGYVWLNKS